MNLDLQNSNTSFHCSKRIYTFTESLRKIVENKGDSIGEVSKPHLLFYNLKLKKGLKYMVYRPLQAKLITIGVDTFE